MREHSCAVALAMVLALVTGAVVARAPQAALDPKLAAVMPKGTLKVAGFYHPSQPVGAGTVTGDLRAQSACSRFFTNETHINLRFKHYASEADVLPIARAAHEQNVRRFEQDLLAHQPTGDAQVRHLSPVLTEAIPGGTLIYYTYEMACTLPPESSQPMVEMAAVFGTDTTFATLEMKGPLGPLPARRAVLEVVNNLRAFAFSR